MKAFQPKLYAMEAVVTELEQGVDRDQNLDLARQHLRSAISLACELDDGGQIGSFTDLVEEASRAKKGRRESAIFLTRALAIDGLLPLETEIGLERHIVALIEQNFSDQWRSPKISDKRQTYEKTNLIKGQHETICGYLGPLSDAPSTLAGVVSARDDINKILKSASCGGYLQPYDWSTLKAKVSEVVELSLELSICRDSTYKSRFDHLSRICTELTELAGAATTFLHATAIMPFAIGVRSALSKIEQEATDQFNCILEPRRRSPNFAEKRYALHQVDKMLTITVPFVNKGPGVAINVRVELGTGASSCLALDAEQITLGDIPPGEFAVSFKAMVLEPADETAITMLLNWNQLFGDTNSIVIDIKLTAQKTDVDWVRLEQLDPYSLEVADGSRFVGRAVKVQTVGNRLLKSEMSSTYITGQKRVGKTSLAQAVLRYVTLNAKPPVSYETFYLEWGEYCTADAHGTMQALGQNLYDFLSNHLPVNISKPKAEFSNSLAPLNGVAKLLEQYSPDKRFVIVLDEFDEIHPEMYRYGPLAETFFANLRTLGARKNLAFILVGGEKMPFIIGAQGDQLNKFGREPVDYFSRSDEWTDYIELITEPVRDSLNWEDAALNYLFNITNGHPYYTKLLCSKIFSNAVAQRDTDIVYSDVRHAFSGKISEMDTNSFAHFWKDGIDAERKEAEVLELRRLRVLVAFGRTLRTIVPTKPLIASHMTPNTQTVFEVGPIVDDFCRRDIMQETGKNISLVLPIFERWVKEIGVTKLISSTLADELESELQKLNDLAYVNAGEIIDAIEKWPLYRGQVIGAESVRAWLDQLDSAQEQRLLFKIIQNIWFVTTAEIGEKLRSAHEKVIRATPPVVRENKVEKRRDLLVTYLDGPGKSGSTYARSYAKENNLLMECVVEPGKALRRLEQDPSTVNGIVVVDDLAGTGGTVATAVNSMLLEIGKLLTLNNIPIFVVVLFATREAEEKIESVLTSFPGINGSLYSIETLDQSNSAFPVEGFGFWADETERDRARALCVKLGAGLYKDALGFGSQALLIAFPDTCPNNSLPIIFSSRTGSNPWDALLPRPTS